MSSPSRKLDRRSLFLACAIPTALVLSCYGLSRGVVPAVQSFFTPYASLEGGTRDKLAFFGKKAPLSPEVVFVAIDTASTTLEPVTETELAASPALQLMKGGYPYPRTVYPLILDRLLKAGAKVVAFDILFPVEKPEFDPAFRAALDAHADHVVIGANIEQRDQASTTDDADRLRHTPVPPAASLIPAATWDRDSRVGFTNFWADADTNTVRRALFKTTSLELEGALAPTAGDPEFVNLSGRILQKSQHADKIPATRKAMPVRFVEDIRPYSLYEIFVPDLWARPPSNDGQFFKDKIVFIGPDGNWVKDELTTPLGPTNGPRIHLSVLNAALTGDFLHETGSGANVLLILAGGGLAWLLGRFVPAPLWRFGLLIVLTLGLYLGAQVLFNTVGFFPILLSPLLAFVSSGVSFSVAEQVFERLEKARLRKTFERYVSRDAVKELLDNPDSFLNTRTGKRKKISLLFSDIRGFTTITESADETQLVTQLNEYFTEMVRIVFAHKGMLDKFIGDAVMAHWGSIVTSGEKTDACNAVSTALHMSRALIELNKGWKTRGMLELKFGIGINFGEAIVGNLGAEEKQEITAIGDAVNVASRLEGATKGFHVELLIGEGVAELVKDDFVLRSVGLLTLKGKTKPLEVFTVLSEKGSAQPAPDWLAHYENGMRCYRTRDFAGAIGSFSEALRLHPGDWLNEEYLRESREFLATPPAPEWDAVLVLTSK